MCHNEQGGPAVPTLGAVYDLTFPARPDLGAVRVRVVSCDEPTPPTPCGARTVPIQIISGQLPRSNPDRVLGPGEVTSIAIFVSRWTRVSGVAS